MSIRHENKTNSIDIKDSGSEAKQRKRSGTFQRIGEKRQILDLHCHVRERTKRKRCQDPGSFSQRGKGHPCGAISGVFNTKENLRDLGKQ